jgi:hypothetical protein
MRDLIWGGMRCEGVGGEEVEGEIKELGGKR